MAWFTWLLGIRGGLDGGCVQGLLLNYSDLGLRVCRAGLRFVTQWTVSSLACSSTALKSVMVLFVLEVRNKEMSFPVCHVFAM